MLYGRRKRSILGHLGSSRRMSVSKRRSSIGGGGKVEPAVALPTNIKKYVQKSKAADVFAAAGGAGGAKSTKQDLARASGPAAAADASGDDGTATASAGGDELEPGSGKLPGRRGTRTTVKTKSGRVVKNPKRKSRVVKTKSGNVRVRGDSGQQQKQAATSGDASGKTDVSTLSEEERIDYARQLQ